MKIGGPSACRQNDFINDLERGIMRDKDQQQVNNKMIKIPLSPQLLLKIYGIEAWALLDTGSQVTAISEKFYEKIKSKNKIIEMPVSNVVVSTAIGSKHTTVKKQVLLEFKCDEYVNNQICLVIPFLLSDIVLGNDWNLENGVIINYSNQSIQIKEKVLSTKSVLFERGASDRLYTAQKDETTFIYIIGVRKNDRNENLNKEVTINNINFICDYDVSDDENEIIKGDEITKSLSQNNFKISEININNDKENKKQIGNNAEGYNLYEELRSTAFQLTTLTAEEQNRLLNVLLENKNMFVEKQGGAVGFKYKLNLIKPNPSIYRSYSIPLHLREKAKEKIQNMKDMGIIERACGSICNPVRWIVKSNGDLRPCLDARWLNSMIENDHESPPIISEIIQEFSNVNYYSKFDLKNSYWQITLHEESRPYTAFLFDSAMYQFTRMPFGLKVAGSAFIRALNKTLENGSDMLRKSLRYYIDDLLIGTDTFNNHIIVLTELFSTLLKFNFTLNLNKCEFCRKSVLFLGFIISADGVTPNPEKQEIIRDFEEPKNKLQLQQILEVCNFYRRFYIMYHYLIEPFRELLKKDKFWE